jgi:hypothetical protein
VALFKCSEARCGSRTLLDFGELRGLLTCDEWWPITNQQQRIPDLGPCLDREAINGITLFKMQNREKLLWRYEPTLIGFCAHGIPVVNKHCKNSIIKE